MQAQATSVKPQATLANYKEVVLQGLKTGRNPDGTPANVRLQQALTAYQNPDALTSAPANVQMLFDSALKQHLDIQLQTGVNCKAQSCGHCPNQCTGGSALQW